MPLFPSFDMPPRAAALERLLCWALGTLAGLGSLACGTILAARRLSGSLERLPGPLGLLAVCGAGILLIAISDAAARVAVASPTARSSSLAATLWARIGLAIALLAVAVPSVGLVDAAAGLPLGGVLAAAAAVAAAAVAVLRPPRRGRAGTPGPGRLVPARDASPASGPAGGDGAAAGTPAPTARQSPPEPLPGHLLQRFERYSLPDQSDCLRGRLTLTVPVGARAAHGHVGFCPPFAETPTVDVTTDCDTVEAIVSAAEVLPWGVRVECRLDEPAEEAVDVPVDLLARSPAARPVPPA